MIASDDQKLATHKGIGRSLNKGAAREYFREKRRELLRKNIPSVAEWLEQVSENLLAVTHQLTGCIGSYQAKGTETQVRIFEEDKRMACPTIDFCYPKVVDGDLQFYVAHTISDLEVGAFDILEPKPLPHNLRKPNKIECLLIPGVAFDQTGTRLGSGHGYYDRYLSQFSGIKIGVGFSCQMSATLLPREDHDVRMDWLVCENYALQISEGKKWN